MEMRTLQCLREGGIVDLSATMLATISDQPCSHRGDARRCRRSIRSIGQTAKSNQKADSDRPTPPAEPPARSPPAALPAAPHAGTPFSRPHKQPTQYAPRATTNRRESLPWLLSD